MEPTILIDGRSFMRDEDNLAELRELVAPSYDGIPTALANDIGRYDRIYRLLQGRQTIAFFLVSFTEIGLGESRRPAIYLGLSAVRDTVKNGGLARQLFCRFTRDARAFEEASKSPVVMFGTLATPSSYFAVCTQWTDVQPLPDGSFSESSRPIAKMAAAWLGANSSPAHPFVLPCMAQETRYSRDERERIARVTAKHNFRLLSSLGIDETRGDRLLVTCRVPPEMT